MGLVAGSWYELFWIIWVGPIHNHASFADMKKKKRLSDISLERWVYLGSAKDLFGVCNHGKPHASPHRTREEGSYREEKEVERGTVNRRLHLFTLGCPWWSSA